MRVRWLVVGALGVLGCESLHRAPPNPVSPPEHFNAPSPASDAVRRSATSPRRGEVGPAGPPESAKENARQTPLSAGERSRPLAAGEGVALAAAATPPTTFQTDPLTLAAEALERGDGAAAAVHLEAYVRLHPEQLMFRAQLAELLVRVGRDDAARVHFERFVADAQRSTGPPRDHLVHAHTRLLEIALRADDPFAEEFHRGVGLLLLVKEQDNSAERDEAFCEEMLCQSMKALRQAKELKPADTRTRVYLAEVYDRTGNRRAAEAE